MNPFVSIVIPVYNEEKYLSKSIESVLNQTSCDFECIILNNCSTDASYDIAKKYEKLDNRIKVYSNSVFLSQAQNLNEVLRKISNSSKYCKIVLADDFIFKECIEKMVEIAESDETIGLVGSYALRGPEVVCTGLPIEKSIYNGKEIGRKYLLSYEFCAFPTQTSVMYLSDIVRSKDKFFNESSLTCDIDVCLEILNKYNFGFVHQILTFTRIDNVSERNKVKRLDTGIMRRLIIHERYGKIYLNEEEYKNVYLNLIKKYYKSLSLEDYHK